MAPDPDTPPGDSEPDAAAQQALERLLELAASLRELPLEDASPACGPPQWE